MTSRPSPADAELAWLDHRGVIVEVNQTWTDFCLANDGDIERCGVGNSYLAVCAVAGDRRSELVATAIRTALAGHLLQPETVHLPCHSDAGARWFDLTVAPATDHLHLGAVVVVGLTPIDGPEESGSEAAGDGRPTTLAGTPWELVEAAPDGTVVADPDGRIAYVNRELERLTGYRREELLGQPLTLLVAEPARGRHVEWEAGYRSAPRHRMMGAGRSLEIRQVDGTLLPVEISLAPVAIGSVIMTVASVRDVSVQRAADAARRQLLHLLDLDPDAVYIVDAATTRIEYANTGAVELLGHSRAELASMTMYDITPAASDATRRSAIEEHHRLGPGHRHEVEVVRRTKDGALIPCRSRGQLVSTEGGDEKFVVVDRDDRTRQAQERSARRREDLAALVASITASVLADAPPADVHRIAVDGIAEALDSENASLVLLDSAGAPTTAAAHGPIAELHHSGDVALPQATIAEWADHEGAFAVPGPPDTMPPAIRDRAGPGVVARFPNPEPSRGVITAFRAKGRPPFDDDDIALLGDFAREVATVLALGEARSARHRLTLLEERQRIARDLHDLVIQELISIGLQLHALPDQASGADRERLVDDLEDAIRSLRGIVFESGDQPAADRATDTLGSVVAQAGRVLGHRAALSLAGDIDAVDPVLVNQIVAVLREGLSNVARHAGAHRTSVEVTVTVGAVTVVISDDGVGPARRDLAGTGVSNLTERARRLGGTATLEPAPGGGSRLSWTVPLPT